MTTGVASVLLGFLGILIFVGICYGLWKLGEWLWRQF